MKEKRNKEKSILPGSLYSKLSINTNAMTIILNTVETSCLQIIIS